MATTTDLSTAPKRRGRKPKAASGTSASAAAMTSDNSPALSSTTDATFTESIQLANAAVKAAKKAAQAKVTHVTSAASDKAKAAKDSVSAFDWKKQADEVKAQASNMARETATTAKGKTSSAMDGLAKLITETAQTVDSKLGPQYGDYARQAANAVAGAAKSLEDKDVDQLLGEARDFVRKSPAVAIGAAAIAGYVLMRLARGSSEED